MKKIAGRAIMVILGLILGGLLFVYFSPDYEVYVVRSESMTPAINMGDVIFTGPVGGPIKGAVGPGTVVTYQGGSGLVTHRVVSITNTGVITRGDAVEEADPRTVSLTQIKGVYLFRIPGWGYVWKYAQTRPGWMLLVVLPASIIIGCLAREVQKEWRKREGTPLQ